MTTFLPLGGAYDIGASCYHLNIDGTGVILDCGTHPRKKGIASLPQFDLIKNLPVDVGLITHAHQDHIDAVPYLVQKHPYVRLITTPQTRGIAELTLHNAVSIIEEQLKDEESLRAYTHDEIDLLIQSIEWQIYNQEFSFSGYRHTNSEPIRSTFFDAGHIMGSSGILIEHDDSSLFFTGDVCIEKQFVLSGAILPQKQIDTLVMECTHGATDTSILPPREQEMKRFVTIANSIFASGGSILIPVFSLGKMQEMLAMIWRLMEKGSLAHTDIYTGGLGKKLCRIYDKNRYVVRVNNPEEEFSSIPQKDLFDVEQLDDLARIPSIVLASSGMVVEGTISFKLAQRWLQHKKNAIFTVGYMDPATPGFQIQMAKQNDMVKLTNTSEPQKVHCSIERFRFSAHSTRDGLMEIVRRLSPKNVVLVHGDSIAIDWMGHTILKQFPHIKVSAAEIGKPISLE